MKRVLQIIFGYLVFSFCVCVVISLFTGTTPLLIAKYERTYRFFGAVKLFCNILPALVLTGFIMGYAVSFGRTPDGSILRFSSAMFKRFRYVMLSSIILSLVLTATAEIGIPFFSIKQQQLEQMPSLLSEYVRIGRQLHNNGKSDLAYKYAELAIEIDPTSEEAIKLIKDTEVAAKTVQLNASKKNEQTLNALSEEKYTVKNLLELAEKAYKEKRWFDAHYYAQTGVEISNLRDINRDRLREIARIAWNELEIPNLPELTEEQKIFAKKFEGYSALMANDNLKAYYIFVTLSRTSKQLEKDPDVVRYLGLAKARIDSEYYFIDEIIDSKQFETASNIYFAIKKNDGTTDIVYIKGIMPVKNSGGRIQYLRGFSIFSLDKDGKYQKGMYVNHAKMRQVPTTIFDSATKASIGIDEKTKYIPYILLRSVDRYTENISYRPTYTYATENINDAKEQIILPISYDDLLLITESSYGTEYTNLFSLFTFANKAKQFGFSSEAFEQIKLSRILYPLFILILLMFAACFAWNYRIGEATIFKGTWIFAYPLFSVIAYIAYQVFMWIFKMINYVFIGISGNLAIAFASVFYVILLAIASISFLARNNADKA